MGQVKGKPTRENMLAKLKNIPGEKFVHITEEWNDKNQIKISEYKQILEDSVFVPCPSGWGGAIGLKDCFRLYETLEAGSIPIVEKDDYKYFDSFFPGHPLIQVSTDWNEIEDIINELLKDKDELKAYNEKLIKWWVDYKSNLKSKITKHFQIKKQTFTPHSDDQIKIENSISQSKHPGFQDFLKFLKKSKINSMAEVGVFKGESTIHYANIVNKIYAIDPWLKNYDSNDKAASLDMEYIEQSFDNNTSSFNNIIKIKDLSINACKLIPDNSLDLIYLDAGHSYESVKEDLLHWIPKISHNGYIAGHDYFDKASECYKKYGVIHWPGVAQAVNEIVGKPEFRFGDSSWAQQLNKTYTSNKLAIIIQSCDHYDFLWDGWKNYFLKNWDFSIPAEVYFCTEDKDFTCDNITNIKTGKCQSKKIKGARTFSGRMKNIVNQIKQDYILYLQEDMWLHKPIDKKLFIDSFDYFVDKGLNAFNFGYKLAVNRKFSMENEVFSIDDFKQYTNTYINDKRVYKRLCEVGHLKTYNPFSVTHHSCFFKKDFMLKYLCIEGEKPIDNEINSSKRIAIDYKNTSPLIQGIDHKWYEHVCDNGSLNKAGLTLSSDTQKLKTCFINIPRNCPIKQKWKLALAALSRNENVLLVSSNLLKVSDKQSIKDYIEEDIDIITSQHNYEEWGVKLNTKITSSFIYIKSSIKSIKLINNLITELTNIKEDKRFYSYKEHFSDCVLENNINNSNLKVKLIPNTEFCVSEEIYGKNIEHYKSNPPTYINFDRNVYTEELKKVYFYASPHNKR